MAGRSRLETHALSAFFGAVHAVKDVSLPLQDRNVTAIIGPSGCGKSTFLRCLNRMHETIPGARAYGTRCCSTAQTSTPSGVNPIRRAAARRHGVPAADALPHDVDSRQRGRRAHHARQGEAQQAGDRRHRRTSAAPRRAVGRSEGPAQRERDGAVRRTAAAPVHRARARDRAGGAPARRADRVARSAQHAEGRGARLRAAQAT